MIQQLAKTIEMLKVPPSREVDIHPLACTKIQHTRTPVTPKTILSFKVYRIFLYLDNKINTNHDYQPSIDVQDLNGPSQSRQSHQRNKTDADRSTNLNNRISLLSRQIFNYIRKQCNPKKQLEHTKQDFNKQDQQTQSSQIESNKSTKRYLGQTQQIVHQTRFRRLIIIQTLQLSKYSMSQILVINSYANDKDRLSYEGSRQDSQQKQRNESISYTDSKQFKQSTIKQIQDFHSTKLDQLNLNKQEDYMKFSFGFQCTKIKSTKKFPKDIFYNDVRKAKKCLSNQ
ncbi:unnamed protein product (macronuclear) [Paramecium tetraurelia]|uniref:Uncharacterized protein n=1 Tax=Paramecium tetraurelia TaxID=5888 RepID=A0EHW7_PARTE|nr:uncharacterized protein GSPATT00027235001 [Paramecium tetraurelia]CAK94908.1 unnamed protein product [Paramecium tetraurelia]|eukprot:XP_001462281.1 hypothetical protein (macronuclear) [Paramecium tetraurelia strain d4-2]